MDAREHGSKPDEASASAKRYMAEVKQIVVPAADKRRAPASYAPWSGRCQRRGAISSSTAAGPQEPGS